MVFLCQFSGKFFTALNIQHKNPKLYRLALMHRSYVHEQNINKKDDQQERLEFFGDAVLKFIVIALGVLILVGTSVVGITIVRRAQDISVGDKLVADGETLNLYASESTNVKSIDVEEGILFLHMETSTGDMVIGYDLFSGEVVNRVLIDQAP